MLSMSSSIAFRHPYSLDESWSLTLSIHRLFTWRASRSLREILCRPINNMGFATNRAVRQREPNS